MGKAHAGDKGLGELLRRLHGAQAQHADAHRAPAQLHSKDLVGILLRALGVLVQVVAREDAHRGAVLRRFTQGGEEIVPGLRAQAEFTHSGHQGVIADGPQGQGLRRAAVLDQPVVHRVTAVQQQGGVHRGPLRLHGGGHILIAVLHCLPGHGVLTVEPPPHVPGGVDAQGGGGSVRRRGSAGSSGQQGRAQQNRRAPFEKMPHPRHSKSPLFAPYKEKLCSVPSHYTSRPDGMQRIGGEC